MTPHSKAQPVLTFDSIQSVVDIVSPRLAHVTRTTTVHFASGNWSYLDWGLWYEGRNVEVTNASDVSGKLAFIYPLPGSDPTQPDLRILFSRAIGANQSYTFTYQYDVTSEQDMLSWSETFDASQALIRSLTITVILPPNYQSTGFEPTSATEAHENGRADVTWSGTNLSGVSDVGLTVGFTQEPTTPMIAFSNLIPYAAAAASTLGVGLYGFKVRQAKRKKRRIDPYTVLQTQAREAAPENARPSTPTGVPVLDYLLNGGLPVESATVITAPACDEKDLILHRIVDTGARDGVSIYLGKDLSKVEDLIDSSNGLQVLVPRVEGLKPGNPQIHLTGKVDKLDDINIDLMSLLRTHGADEKPKRLCIDLLDDSLLVHKTTLTRRWLTTLLSRVKGLGFTVIATLNSQMHSPADMQAIIDLFDGHIQLLEKTMEDRPRIVLRVQKMFRWKIVETEAVLDRTKGWAKEYQHPPSAGRPEPPQAPPASELTVTKPRESQPPEAQRQITGLSDALQAGDTLQPEGLPGNPKFRITQILHGGMGIIYVCIDETRPREKICAKTFKDLPLAQEHGIIAVQRTIQLFDAEALAWIKLPRHPNVVKAHFISEIMGKPYIFTEYVEGSNLRQLIQRGVLDTDTVGNIALQICGGMEFVHSYAIVHADLKPENILIDKQGHAKLTDFGIARALYQPIGHATETEARGTRAYMAPEALESIALINKGSDIYSFGVVLVEMLTGKPAASTREVEKATQPAPGLRPIDFKPIIDRCLQHDPESRYRSFTEVRLDLERTQRTSS